MKHVILDLEGNTESTLDALWEIVSKPFVQRDSADENEVQEPYTSYGAMCVDLLSDVGEVWLDKVRPACSTTFEDLERQKAARIGDAALSHWASGNTRTIAGVWSDEGFSDEDVEKFLELHIEAIEQVSGRLDYLATQEALRILERS